MKSLSAAALLAMTVALPGAVSAQGMEWSGEVGLNVAKAEGGNTETTVNGAVELSFGNAFVGIEGESYDGDPADDFEYTLSIGYNFDLGSDVEATLSYARIYKNNSGFDDHEVGLAFGFPVADGVDGGIEAVYAIDGEELDVSAGLEIGLTDKLSTALLFGSAGGTAYGEFGISYALTDNLSAGFLLEFEKGAPHTFNVGVTYAFGG